jgi:branched-chain amino acid transport system permease protein
VDPVSLIVMAVFGGAGTRWGAVLGGVVYAYLDQRLTQLDGGLPGPFGQPLFILGTLFVLAVYFARGGLVGLLRPFAPGGRIRATRRNRREPSRT